MYEQFLKVNKYMKVISKSYLLISLENVYKNKTLMIYNYSNMMGLFWLPRIIKYNHNIIIFLL